VSPRYKVILDVIYNGASIGSTEDVIDADDAADAEEQAIQSWKAVRPGCTFHPLLTVARFPRKIANPPTRETAKTLDGIWRTCAGEAA
jgi:hypothetical protein